MRESFFIAIISMVLGFVFGYLIFRNGSNENEWGELSMRIDTIVRIVPAEPLIVERVKTKVIYKGDTIVEARPFVATVDTVVKQDTIFARYEFPENLFSLNLRRSDDTLRTVMVKTEVVKSEGRDWWEGPAIGVAGVVVGYLLRSLIR